MLVSRTKDNMIPATLLKEHGEFYLMLEEGSASLLDANLRKKIL